MIALSHIHKRLDSYILYIKLKVSVCRLVLCIFFSVYKVKKWHKVALFLVIVCNFFCVILEKDKMVAAYSDLFVSSGLQSFSCNMYIK